MNSITITEMQPIGAAQTGTETTSQSQNNSGSHKMAREAKTKKTKDYQNMKPVYTDDQETKLMEESVLAVEEIRRVIGDPSYEAVGFAHGENAIINLTAAVKNGHRLVRTKINRSHGNDEETTGESILTYGPQHPVIVCTVKMAEKAGLECENYEPDETTEIQDTDLMTIDGHGRVHFLHSHLPVNKWPDIYGIFPSKNAAGYIDLKKCFEEINTNIAKWKTQDLAQKRMLQEGQKAHDGWRMLNELVRRGYGYEAASVIVTLGSDRIKASEVNKGDSTQIFKNFNEAMKIYNAAMEKFGDSDNDVLKTKSSPKCFAAMWNDLVRLQGVEYATGKMMEFISALPDEEVSKLKEAKNDSKNMNNRLTKDLKRENILKDAFAKFRQKENI